MAMIRVLLRKINLASNVYRQLAGIFLSFLLIVFSVGSAHAGDDAKDLQIELATMLIETFSGTSVPRKSMDMPMLALGFPIESLPGIVEHGFLTPWELGLDVANYRQHLESSIYGFDVKKLNSLAPKYAHYFDSRSLEGFHFAYLYGDMLAILKPDIHRRTLVTSGDSSKLGIWDLSPIGEERRIKSTDGLQYMEAQVLGPLDLSHVEAIYVNRGNEAAMNQLDFLINLCGDFNIKLFLYTPGGDLLTHMAQVSAVQPVTSKAIRGRRAHHGKQVSVGARFEGIEVDAEEIRRSRESNREIFERLISSGVSEARTEDREVINVLRRIVLTAETSHRSKQRAVDLYRKTKMSDPYLEYFLRGVQPEKSADYNDLKKLSTREIRTLRNLNYPFVESELQLLQEERNLSSWSFEVPSESPFSPKNFNVRDFLTALKILMEADEKIPAQTMRSFFQYASFSIIRGSEMALSEVQLRFIAKAWFIATFRTEGIQSDDLPHLFALQPRAKEIFREEFVLQLKSLSVHQSRDFIRRAFDAYLHLEAISFASHELGHVQAENFIELVRSQPSRWNFNMAFALLPFETYLRLTVETLSRLPFHQISKENRKLFVVEVERAFDKDMKFSEPVLENIKDKLLFIESLSSNDVKRLRRKLAWQKSCLHIF